MKNSQLIQILKSFSPEEIKEFGKFIESPISGCRKFVVRFFKVLSHYHPDFKEENISKEKLFRKLYGEKEFNDGLMRRMISDLIRYAEEFLKLKNFKDNRTFQNAALLNELQKRDLGRIFQKKFEKMNSEIINSGKLNSKLILESFLLNTEVRRYRTFLRDERMNKSFDEATEALITFFIEAFYSYINHIRTFADEYHSPSETALQFGKFFDFPGFVRSTKNIEGKYSNYIRMICYCHELIADPEDRTSYEKLKRFLIDKSAMLDPTQIYSCLVIMSRFCSYQNLNYFNRYIKESFRIYDIILREKYFLLDANSMQLSFCRNLVTICKSLKEFEYIRNFISDYSKFFHDEYREGFLNFCNAILKFAGKDYEAALEHAILVDIDKPVFKKDVKILKMKAYYELGHMESLFAEIDALKHLLSGARSLRGEISMRAKSFAVILSRVAKLKSGIRKDDPEMLLQELKSNDRVIEKPWLLKKIGELIVKQL
ncbi:MAG: hypothetical protein K1X85_03835 [Ignavibacteria bacterium]|nr:hypothetical protein [Ignavibacteria bacterium]